MLYTEYYPDFSFYLKNQISNNFDSLSFYKLNIFVLDALSSCQSIMYLEFFLISHVDVQTFTVSLLGQRIRKLLDFIWGWVFEIVHIISKFYGNWRSSLFNLKCYYKINVSNYKFVDLNKLLWRLKRNLPFFCLMKHSASWRPLVCGISAHICTKKNCCPQYLVQSKLYLKYLLINKLKHSYFDLIENAYETSQMKQKYTDKTSLPFLGCKT